MACGSVALGNSPAASMKDMFKEYNGLHRSHSSKDLGKRTCIRRSYSDNHLCHHASKIYATSTQEKPRNNNSTGIFPFRFSSSVLPESIKSFLFDMETVRNTDMGDTDVCSTASSEEEVKKRANWIERLLEVRRYWQIRQQKERAPENETYAEDETAENDCSEDAGGCAVDYSSEDEENVKYDAESFAKYLVHVPLSDTRLFSRLAFLSNMAYVIPQIKEEDLKRDHGLQFVTSSLQKKANAAIIKQKLDQHFTCISDEAVSVTESCSGKDMGSGRKQAIPTSVAYEIAATAASYVQSKSNNLSHPSEPKKGHETSVNGAAESSTRVYNPEVAAYVAASAMTAVVAAEEMQKQKTAKDLQSLHSSPCEWFVCDDSTSLTRCFVIQGSDSLASWQANLFFEPSKFEGTDVLVHRGIYEAAKGIYMQFMPEIIDHLKTYGNRAKFQFTGHSLGGSLSLLVHLMLIKNGILEPCMVQPVVTFGSPFVFCGGEKILKELGLDEKDIHCVIMHRDIVPRAFSCNYPDHVAALLKRLSGSFRSHSCLNKNKLLYSPLGKLFILQPEEKSSPPHPLLPGGSALYAMESGQGGQGSKGMLRAFLNCPHPLETLSHPSAYGSEGSILRDHDSSFYLQALTSVLTLQTQFIVRRATHQKNLISLMLWSHVGSNSFISTQVMTRV